MGHDGEGRMQIMGHSQEQYVDSQVGQDYRAGCMIQIVKEDVDSDNDLRVMMVERKIGKWMCGYRECGLQDINAQNIMKGWLDVDSEM